MIAALALYPALVWQLAVAACTAALHHLTPEEGS